MLCTRMRVKLLVSFNNVKIERLQHETDTVCAAYLKGRSLGDGLAALKALMEKRGLCGRTMLPPIRDYTGQI